MALPVGDPLEHFTMAECGHTECEPHFCHRSYAGTDEPLQSSAAMLHERLVALSRAALTVLGQKEIRQVLATRSMNIDLHERLVSLQRAVENTR